ncbi:hypothetical protein [Fluviicola sp.]|uniref:hypothetical protein n=1 Tax=Fluviicola sp. TaxID=1917219 RepID=UPI00262744EF|nr:hypothetical protein [Fluviicola sp.]
MATFTKSNTFFGVNTGQETPCLSGLTIGTPLNRLEKGKQLNINRDGFEKWHLYS